MSRKAVLARLVRRRFSLALAIALVMFVMYVAMFYPGAAALPQVEPSHGGG